MNIEENRLQTFSEWPSDAVVDSIRIAKAGFFSTRNGLTVECFSCHLHISEWNYGDQVMARHRALSPECLFVTNPATSGNVPLIAPSFLSPSSSSTDLTSEEDRLVTFENWPIANIVTPENLARAGFYYLRVSDKTKCAYCDGIVMSWELGDDPDTEHKRHFPRCSFVINIITPRLTERSPIIEPNAMQIQTRSALGVSENGDSLNSLGVYIHQGPKHLQYATIESRIRTFVSWPADLIQTPDLLALAGFYYEGVSDQVRCFHCDGGLRNWDPVDDPWTEHARWFPACSFVKLVKGQDFVEACSVELNSGRNEDANSPTQNNRRRGPSVSNQLRGGGKQITTRHRTEVSEQDLQVHMTSPVALAALDIGLNVERVKRAIRQKLEQTGRAYSQPDALVEAALNLQHDEDDSVTETDDSSIICHHVRPHVPRRVDPPQPEPKQQSVIACLPSAATPVRNVSLEEENRILKEARLCKICMDIEVGIVFLPCGHLTACINCAPNLEACPVCRSAIKATVRTFLS